MKCVYTYTYIDILKLILCIVIALCIVSMYIQTYTVHNLVYSVITIVLYHS